MKKTVLLLCVVVLMAQHKAIGQRHQPCTTVEYNKKKQLENPVFESEQQFEKWIKNKQQERRRQATRAAPYTVPIVFHIIHNGEPEGSGANISDERIRTQVEGLNEDFQRRNADADSTVATFKSVAGNMNITFVLAQQTPEGISSNGIVRVKGGKKEWKYEDESFKQLSQWPAKDYFNVWVVNFDDHENQAVVLGYAEFPKSDQLQGLDNLGPDDEAKDGVVVSYHTVGIRESSEFRTLTHETGHFLGLRHIWGDEISCYGKGDYVDDTPPQSSPTEDTCPSHPFPDCEGARMFQNYMDYTDSRCMNLFTKQQAERMQIVMEKSPRRATLCSSKGSKPPVLVADDLFIINIISPQTTFCKTGTITPHVQIINRGNNTILSARIELRINKKIAQIKNIDFTPGLGQFEKDTVFYNPITLSTSGEQRYTFKVLQVNEKTKDNLHNDTISSKFSVPHSTALPFFETFDDAALKWEIQNPDGDITWKSVVTHNNGLAGRSVYLDFYNYGERKAVDNLLSPTIQFPEFSHSSAPVLKFDWFYPPSDFNRLDSLKVIFINGCDTNPSHGITVFSTSGNQLATTPDYISDPAGISNWKTISIPLGSAITGLTNPQVMFSGINGYGSSLYIDNVSIFHPYTIKSPYRVHNSLNSKDIKITFNLTKREWVHLKVYTITGMFMVEDIIPDALDQTYTIPVKKFDAGIYLLRMRFRDRVEVTRIFVGS